MILLLRYYFTDSSYRGEITEFNFIWWEIPKSTWFTTQNRPTLYPLPWNVPFRFNLYWRRNSKFYWQWITQFCQNENGNVCITYSMHKKQKPFIKPRCIMLRSSIKIQIWFQIGHVIREIRQFQQTPYKIEPIPKVLNYLLDPSR